ncbi:hypothetical protein GBA52_015407 [Prunus armeniaca]|nr:hypothetical protein GBA52_015407 [Prunus armeniaca]
MTSRMERDSNPRPTLSTAQTSILFALRSPYLYARWQVGAYLCDSLRLLAHIGGLYCLPVSETFPVVRIATVRLFLYDNMHLGCCAPRG